MPNKSQIKFDKNFIKKLLEKLQVGNARSIHLNALPGRLLTRLDLFALTQIDDKNSQEKNTAEKFIDTLLSEDVFKFDISYNSKLSTDNGEDKNKLFLLSKRLDSLVIENNDNFLEIGVKNFGFGFPILIKRDSKDPTKIIKAPLFIWNLDIVKDVRGMNKWQIIKEKDSLIQLNELLASHLLKNEQLQLEKLPEEVLEYGILDKDELLELCERILSKLNASVDNLEVRIEKCLDKKTIDSIANDDAWIQWSGVFGIYRSQKETIISNTKELLERAEEFTSQDLILDKFQTSTISAVETDPSKEEVVNTLTKDEIKLIQGPPGTGKSQAITAIISNALANKARCLVICEKKTALDVIQNNLEKIGLSDFSILIDDIYKDRAKLIKKAREIKESNENFVSFSDSEFSGQYKKFEKLKNEINNKHHESLKLIFDRFTWKQLIGHYLHFSKLEDFQSLYKELNYKIFDFSNEEYTNYLNKIEEASNLYDKLTNESKDISIRYFYLTEEEQYNWSVQETIKKRVDKGFKMIKEFGLTLDKETIGDSNFVTISNSIKKLYVSGSLLLGEKVKIEQREPSKWFSFLAIFSKRHKKFNNIRKELFAFVDSFFDHIDKFNFKIKIPTTFEEVNDINLDVYERAENYFCEFNHYFQNHDKNYEELHNWLFFKSSCSNVELFILNTIKETPHSKWVGFFKAWYYRGAILDFEKKSDCGFNKSDDQLKKLSEINGYLKKQQIQQIKKIWQDKRANSLTGYSGNFNTLYNLRRNKTHAKRNALRKIIATDIDLFTTLFPVILTNPSAANAILPLEQGLFDIVIFDEASQLRVADTFTSLIRGKYKVIAGDEHQMPPSNYFQSNNVTIDSIDENIDEEDDILADSESLLQYAQDLRQTNCSNLDFHYRSKHPALIDFSNNAFYGGNLVPFPAKKDYKVIDFKNVNGQYISNTNPSEIEEILKILDTIKVNKKGKYPSIGIATFNISQRNLIIETLNVRAENNQVFFQKLTEFKKAGLFIKNLENIQGDEKYIIIISTTYGIKEDGRFIQNFGRINRIEGYKLLNVLITRAKYKVYVLTSIPKEKYATYANEIEINGNNKKGILYAYLSYAEALSNDNQEIAKNILSLLKSKSIDKPRIHSDNDGLSESPFEEEVYLELQEHFKKEQIIQQYKIGGFRVDFLICVNNKEIVLECDGKAYHQSNEAYAYDMYRQKELENIGYIVYRIWSTNWFQNKENEIKKFQSFILKIKKTGKLSGNK